MPVKERTTLTLDRQAKTAATPILDELGMSLSTFVDISLKQLVRDRGMPFTPSIGGAPRPTTDGNTATSGKDGTQRP